MFGPQGLVSYGGLSCVKSVYIGFCAPIELRKKIEGRLSKLNIKVKTIKIEKYSISF